MAGFAADVVELAHAVLACLIREHGLVEGAGGIGSSQQVSGSRHQREVTEADLARLHRPKALWERMQMLTDRDPIGGGRTGHVAIDTNPVDGGGGTLALELIGGSERRGVGGEDELEAVDGPAKLNEFEPDLLTAQGRHSPHPHFHVLNDTN